MPDDGSKKGKPVQRLVGFVKRNIVDDVPEEIALCEFDCRKGQCEQGEWVSCDRRVRKASGELFPNVSGAGQP
jgi:hypothetical protein